MTRPRLFVLVLAAWTFLVVAGTATADPPPANPPPAPTLDSHPTDPTNKLTAKFDFSEADPSGITFQCTLDTGKAQPCDSGTISYPAPGDPPLTEGSHTFSVVAVHGKDTSDPTKFTWTIDTTPPAAPSITKRPPSLSGSSASFEFAGADASETVTFMCSLDGAPEAACSSPQTYTGLADGGHSFDVKAVDAATNESAVTNYTWTVDTTAPTISMASAPNLRTNATSATFAFGSEDGAHFLCSIDGAAFAPCVSPIAYDDLGDGSHTFRLEAADAAGNLAGPVAYSWVVDTIPPGLVLGLRALVTYQHVTLSWQLPSDSDLHHLTLFERRPRTLQSTAAYTGLATRYTEAKIENSRTYSFSVVTYDSVGNASGAASVTVPPDSLLREPRLGAKVSRSPSLSWSPAPGAKFYNVQIFHNGKKILSTWPRGTRLRLAAHWTYARRARSLGRGWYDWYVWPAFGQGRSMHYGQELGHSTFRR